MDTMNNELRDLFIFLFSLFFFWYVFRRSGQWSQCSAEFIHISVFLIFCIFSDGVVSGNTALYGFLIFL